MNAYSIFWMIEEIAYHYFHKSDILYRFLVAYHHNDDKQHLSNQYHYITKQFPKDKLMSHIKKHCQENHIHFQIESNTVELYKDENFVALHVDRKKVTIYCETLHSAEQLIFPILRIFHPLLFILSEHQNQYGWISPLVRSDETNREEVLYSLR